MADLAFDVLDSSETALTKTSTLVYGDDELMVVDAGFTRAQAHRVVAAALDTGRRVTRVFVSGGDPGFYFGVGIVADAFPAARVFATPRVVDHILRTYEDEVTQWGRLGSNLPTRRSAIDTWADGTFEFEGHQFELHPGDDTLSWRGDYVWQPQTHTVLGGALLYGGDHVWTADTPTAAERQAWEERLREVHGLGARQLVPGHRRSGWKGDPATWTLEYLDMFDRVVAETTDPDAAARALREQFPEAGLVTAVELGTKVALDRLTWQ
ncbi:MBL fold metallo-hydrolase [Cellulomonas sp. P22]|uniref:MBL fold metallo-hydrolase n=1 Tax=Cellulomonas sp. P22 TaxID=3373189 RepID=UPI0037B06364